MGENIRGYQNIEIVRKVTGSPAVDFTFTNVAEKIDLVNLGGVSDVFYSVGGTALNSYAGSVGSVMGLLQSGGELAHTSLFVRSNTISVIGSGAGSPFVQATGYW